MSHDFGKLLVKCVDAVLFCPCLPLKSLFHCLSLRTTTHRLTVGFVLQECKLAVHHGAGEPTVNRCVVVLKLDSFSGINFSAVGRAKEHGIDTFD